MKPAGGLVLALLAAAAATAAEAGAWPQPKGKGQVILKFEDMGADDGFGPSGELAPCRPSAGSGSSAPSSNTA